MIGKPSQHLLGIFERISSVLKVYRPASILFILTGLADGLDLYAPIGPEGPQRHLIIPVRQLDPHQPL